MSTLAQATSVKPPSSLEDEKYERNEKVLTTFDDSTRPTDLTSSEIGEVFTDGPRLIDLGEDGKERPIGVFSRPISASTIGLMIWYMRQKLIWIIQLVYCPSMMIPICLFGRSECGFYLWAYRALALCWGRYLYVILLYLITCID